MSTTRESDKFIIRLPEGMRDRIKAAAEANNRSMNAEIVAVLEEAYPAPLSAEAMTLEVKHLLELVRRLDTTDKQRRAAHDRLEELFLMKLLREK